VAVRKLQKKLEKTNPHLGEGEKSENLAAEERQQQHEGDYGTLGFN